MPLPKALQDELTPKIQTMIDAGESDEAIQSMVGLFVDRHDTTLDQTLHEFKGVLEGVIPGAWGAVKSTLYDLPKGVYHDLNAIAKGGNPEYVKGVFDSLVNLPGEFYQSTHEDRGKMIGNAVGGLLAGRYAPMAPKPLARGAGALMETVGNKGGWPIRMMGAHQLGAGNPAGVLIMALPEALKTGGAALKRFGGAEPSGAPAFRTDIEKNLSKSLEKAPGAAEKLSDVDKAIAEAKKESGRIRIGARKMAEQAGKAEMKADLEQLHKELKAANSPDSSLSDEEILARYPGARIQTGPASPKGIPLNTIKSGPLAAPIARVGQAPGEIRGAAQSQRIADDLHGGEPLKVPSIRFEGAPISPEELAKSRTIIQRQSMVPEPVPASSYTEETGFVPRGGVQEEIPSTVASRGPHPLILTPEEALQEEQALRALRPGARMRGMQSAGRGMRTTITPHELDRPLDDLLRKRLRRQQEEEQP